MKRLVALILVGMMIVTLSSCGKSLSDRAAEQLASKMTDSNVKIDGDNVTIEGKEGGSFSVGGDLRWPEGKMGDIPKINGKVVSFIDNGNKGGIVNLEGTSKEDAEKYIQELKDLGYSGSDISQSGNNNISFSGEKDNQMVNFNFFLEDGADAEKSTCMIIYGVDEDNQN